MTKKINKDVLQVLFEEFMIKIGKEDRIEYYSSSFDDLYIMIKIEHSGVYDIAIIDFQTDKVDMCIYDEYKFIICDHLKLSLSQFSEVITDMSNYWDMMLLCMSERENCNNASKR